MPVTKSTLADVPALNTLVNSAYRGDTSKKGWTTEANLLSGSRIDEATLTTYISNPNITILKYTDDAGIINGCVYLEDKTDHLYLGMFSVSPRLQAGGIGRLLLHEAETFAAYNNFPLIRMTVISTRAELISWYIRRGYTANGEILPFVIPEKFGIPNTHIELMVLEKRIIL